MTNLRYTFDMMPDVEESSAGFIWNKAIFYLD
jgi:hypothetical protein